MNEFTASNGVRIEVNRSDPSRVAVVNAGGHLESVLTPDRMQALREFFQAETDERLGRWRWPENPDYVVYHWSQPQSSGVVVVSETEAVPSRVLHVGCDPENATPEYRAARAYFYAHSEPKPLPTVPGLYLGEPLGSLATIWSLDGAGRWLLINTNSVFPVEDGHIQKYLPFTRLIPEVS